MNPFGARSAWLALWPQLFTPRFSAVSITTLGLSMWQAMISQPAATSALAASASRTGNAQSPVTISCTVALGLTLRAPRMNEVKFGNTSGLGLSGGEGV